MRFVNKLVLGKFLRSKSDRFLQPMTNNSTISNGKPAVLMPPEAVRGLVELEREKFTKNVTFLCVRISDRLIGRVIGSPVIRRLSIEKMSKIKPVMDDSLDHSKKLIVFDPELVNDEERTEIERSLSQLIGEDQWTFDVLEREIRYEDWNVRRCIEAILPIGLQFSGYSTVGHICQCNFRPELLPYKKILADILLDKIATCRTVVNKSDVVSNEFRFFEMELLAGEADFATEMKEKGWRYRLDFSKVFWNPRLSNEHDRLVGLFDDGDLIFDAFCGIGPFVIPAAGKCGKPSRLGDEESITRIFANDLNPESIRWLRENIELNKIPTSSISVYNMDAADFIRDIIPKRLVEFAKKPIDQEREEDENPTGSAHIIMNLPALAVTFLPNFWGILLDWFSEEGQLKNLPTVNVHCHLFSKAPAEISNNKEDVIKFYMEDAKDQVLKNIGYPNLHITQIHRVRLVAPRKEMLCVSFVLPASVMMGKRPDEFHLSPEQRKRAVGPEDGSDENEVKRRNLKI